MLFSFNLTYSFVYFIIFLRMYSKKHSLYIILSWRIEKTNCLTTSVGRRTINLISILNQVSVYVTSFILYILSKERVQYVCNFIHIVRMWFCLSHFQFCFVICSKYDISSFEIFENFSSVVSYTDLEKT